MKKIIFVLIAISTILFTNSVAFAGSSNEAREYQKKGDKYANSGDYEKAVMEFEKAYDVSSDYKLLFKIAEAESKLNNHKRAGRSYKRFLKEGGKKIGKRQRKKTEDEIERLASILKQSKTRGENKKRAASHFKQGVRFKKAGQHEQAAYAFEQALDLFSNYKIYYSLAGSLIAIGRAEKALNAYESYLKEGGSKIDGAKRSEVTREVERLRIVVAQDAGKKKAREHYAEGRGFFTSEQYERAMVEFEKAYRLDTNYKYLYTIGKTAIEVGDNAKAIKAFRKYLASGGSAIGGSKRKSVERDLAQLESQANDASNREKAREHYQRGIDLYSQRQYESSAKELKMAYKLHPNSKILYRIGLAEGQAENFEIAIRAYKKFLMDGGREIPSERRDEVKAEIARLSELAGRATDRKMSSVHYSKGKTLAGKNQHKSAVLEYEKAYDLYPSFRILYTWAKSESMIGNGAKAILNYNLYLQSGGSEITPDRKLRVENEVARLESLQKEVENKKRAKEHYKQGLAYRDKGKYEKAAVEFKASYDLYQNYKILYELGKSYVKSDNAEVAIETLDRYLEEGGRDIDDKRRAKVEKEIDQLGQLMARSEKKQRSREHFEKGMALRKDSSFSASADEFKKAYELYPNYRILYHVAKSQAGAGQAVDAINNYNRFLVESKGKIDPNRQTEVKQDISRLYPKVGIVELECSVKGAKILVDGKVQGTTPVTKSLVVEPGSHSVVVSLDGNSLLEKEVSLEAGNTVALQVTGDDMGDLEAAEAETALTVDGTDEEDGERPKRIWTWVAAGVGGAGLIGWAVAGGIALDKEAEVLELCPNSKCPNDPVTLKDARDARDITRDAALAADILMGVGIAGLAVGTVLFFFEPKWFGNDEEEIDVSVGPAAFRDGGGLLISGSF
jgi:tetratricopeptide (TPR) repeat protein